jgi:hypothetical protein
MSPRIILTQYTNRYEFPFVFVTAVQACVVLYSTSPHVVFVVPSLLFPLHDLIRSELVHHLPPCTRHLWFLLYRHRTCLCIHQINCEYQHEQFLFINSIPKISIQVLYFKYIIVNIYILDIKM